MFSRVKKYLVYLLLLVCTGKICVAQPYYFSHYQVENGLSNNAVLSIIQDHLGFMWFGSRDGLNRFDGLSFKIFRSDTANRKSIGSNAINCLYEDDKQHIWAGTEKGLFVFDEATESFTKLPASGNGSILAVRVRGDDVFYITLYTLYKYNQKNKTVQSYKVDREVTSYYIQPDGNLWIATGAGLIKRYNEATKTFDKQFDVFSKSPYTVSKWIESIYDAGDGTFLIGTSNQGLKSLNINTGEYKDILTLNADKTDIIVRDILAVNPHEYWIATQSGIFILNPQTGSYINLSKQYNDPYSLSDNIVHTLCKDKEGNIWAGTYFGGINYYSVQGAVFKKYFPKVGANSISGNAVREIHADKEGKLWIGTEDAGLNKFDPATEQFINFNPETNKQSVSYSNIHSLLADGDKIWAGTYLHGLDVLDRATGKRIAHYNTTTSAIGSNFIYCLYKTKAGEIIAGTDKGLFSYIPSTNNFKPITAVPPLFFRTICETPDGTMWTGTYGDGIYFYNLQTGAKGHFTFEANGQGLPTNLINGIFLDSKNQLWFATEGGLCRYDTASKKVVPLRAEDGFPASVTSSILEDSKHNLWVSTTRGLVCFSPTAKKSTVYTKAHGLLTDQFNYSSAYKDGNGRMYFGSVKGLISFNPDSIENSNFKPPVYITGFQVYNNELVIGDKDKSPLQQSITHTNKLTLTYNQSSFSIDFAALSFRAPAMIHYAYKMENLEKDWTYLATNRKAYFTELAPGSYTFVVKTFDNEGVQGNYARLNIVVLPPFWKTWWAYTLYTLAFLVCVYFVIRYFITRSRERNRRKLEKLAYEKEKENYEDKINFFANVAHEIRTPLTLIQGPMENIMDQVDEVPAVKKSMEIMSRNTDRLIHLTNQLLDFRKVEMNGFRLNFAQTNISNLLLDHQLRFLPAAEQKKIDVRATIPDNVTAMADEEALNKIFSNLWDNAIKYAATKADVTLAVTDEGHYAVTFKNDGYLIPAENKDKIFTTFYRIKETSDKPGTGIGLALAKQLAEMHGGTLTLHDQEDSMNVFVLILPLTPGVNYVVN
jgi:signal transduction histidine kinase/ligand-binding sensor domain-containing protein